MKTEKINQTINKIITRTKDAPAPRINLTTEPDVVDIPRTRQTFAQKFKTMIGMYSSGLNKSTVKELNALPFEQFLTRAYEISSDSTGIPKNLRAPVVYSEMAPKIGMAYGIDTNTIEINTKNKFLNPKNRKLFFSCLKHEHRHQLQNFNIMRTEGLGEEYIQILAQRKTDMGIKTFASTFREMPAEKLEELKPQLGENYSLVTLYQAAVAQGQDAENAFLKEVAENDYKIFFEELKTFRDKVIEEMGTIPANSKEAEISKLNFDSIIGTDQNDIASIKTAFKPHELEAYLATTVSYLEFMLARFIK